MKIKHCNKAFDTSDVWFLSDLFFSQPKKKYTNRVLYYGACPICNEKIVILTQSYNDKVFTRMFKGDKALDILKKERANVKYTAKDCDRQNIKKAGWDYGVNVQIKNKKGQITQVRQYAKSLTYGAKTLERKIKF